MKQPKNVNRRTFLRLTGGGSVAMTLLAGCSAISSNQTPTHSYEAITGLWGAETPPGRRLHEWATVEFSSNQGAVGEEIGSVKIFKTKGGDVVCQGSLTVHHSDPPTYWVDVKGESFPCDIHRRYRFKHKPHKNRDLGSRLRWFISDKNEDIYQREASLKRISG